MKPSPFDQPAKTEAERQALSSLFDRMPLRRMGYEGNKASHPTTLTRESRGRSQSPGTPRGSRCVY